MLEKLVQKECVQILTNNYIGHLGYVQNNTPYVIPITYYYDPTENAIFSYSSEGHKVKAMRKNKTVALQVEAIKTLNNWMSVLAHGIFEEIQGSAAKMYLHRFAQNVKRTMADQEGINEQSIVSFSSKINSGTVPIIYRINVLEIIGRKKFIPVNTSNFPSKDFKNFVTN